MTEIVTFRLNDGISDSAFLALCGTVNTYLDTCPGFVRRRLSKGEDGIWCDHLEWQSMEQARAASDGLMVWPEAGPFIAAISTEGVSMRHEAMMLARN